MLSVEWLRLCRNVECGVWNVEWSAAPMKNVPMKNWLHIVLHQHLPSAIFCLAVFFMETSMRFSSSQSAFIESNWCDEIYCVFCSNRSQYRVSLRSFRDMYVLATKSLLVIAHCASAIFAPMPVPLLNIWSAMRYSCFSSFKKRHKPTIRMEKFIHFSSTIFPKSLIKYLFCPALMPAVFH